MSINVPQTIISRALKRVGLGRGDVYSNLKRDETLVFFNTTAWYDDEAQEWNIPIHGWVYEPQSSWALQTLVAELLERKYGLKATADAKARFKQRVNLFTVDNERRKRIIIELNDQLFELPKSEANGQFLGIIKLPDNSNLANSQGLISFKAALKTDDDREFNGKVMLHPASGVSVISDIDDTVKVSYITNRKKMFDVAFFQEFEAVSGMPELYQKWQAQGAQFHFVSSSPWQMYSPIERFMRDAGFPWASFSLKKVRIKDETFLNLFKSGLVTKPVAIKAIMDRYPARKFVLVGDSGEQDAQVYAQIAREYPSQIAKIYIRNVQRSDTLNREYEAVFEGLSRRLWSTFIYPSQIKLDIGNITK